MLFSKRFGMMSVTAILLLTASGGRPSQAAAADSTPARREETMCCKVTKLAQAPTIDAKWDKFPWQSLAPERICRYMGEKPAHFPQAEVKIAYDEAALYLIFRVQDRYVRAVTAECQGAVCQDSCVEFFFTPCADVSQGYFNVEVNCGGTVLFNFQRARQKDVVEIPEAECRKLSIAHSMPRIVDPEIATPVTWMVEYRVPIEILKKYCPAAVSPTAGTVWRANFYKCGDNTSHPHWLTWSRVDFPRPQFHLPECFGVLKFE